MRDIVIMGAHTAVARSLVERLADRDVTSGIVQATTSAYVESDLVLLDEQVLERGGLYVLAMSEALPVRIARAVAERGLPVIDVAEALDEGPYAWPGLVAQTRPPAGLQRVAVGPAGPLAAVIAALEVFRPAKVHATTLESAAARGQPGIDELSAHTRGVFSMQDVEPEVFGASLAFDPIPSLASGDAHPHDADHALVEQVQSGLQAIGQSPPSLAVTRVLVPTFVADSATVFVETEDPAPEAQTVIDTLTSGRALRYVPRPLVPALDAVDRDDTIVSRVRVGPNRIDLWLCYDRLRAGSAVPAALLADAWRQGQPDR